MFGLIQDRPSDNRGTITTERLGTKRNEIGGAAATIFKCEQSVGRIADRSQIQSSVVDQVSQIRIVPWSEIISCCGEE